ncbi:dihydrofolate reductase family protein [Membranihabitans maritimus]|uniref:dihydrofolate reductase family protein n=1 Tax=Membranihabitans maritimus TaxID=2904244 RepID=UPI001F320D2D|nr:dihydrofolate reductase family protein [Membranihabitans maritimus]
MTDTKKNSHKLDVDLKVPRVRVEGFTISLDGYGAGPDQSIDHPLGIGGEELHHWLISTRSWRQMHGKEGGAGGVDDEFAARGSRNAGAWILGRHMFGPIRGPWPDMDWKGWWGNNPPYHVPVYVLTHHYRPPLEMEGGTTFYFVTEGIHYALERAREAANGKEIRIGGGVNTIHQFLNEGLIDELHIAIAPVFLGKGERLFEGVDLPSLGYRCEIFMPSEKATHVIIRRKEDQND